MPSYSSLMTAPTSPTYRQAIQDPTAKRNVLSKGGGNSQEQFEMGLLDQSLGFGDAVTKMTPEERAFLRELVPKGEAADQGVQDEMAALHARGEDLSNVDAEYMNRAYQPAYERLMNDYNLMDANILADMTKRGISSQGSSAEGVEGVASTPEMTERRLLARDTKDTLGRNMLEAQNQAVAQKLAQYQGRTAEVAQANERFGQVQAPVIGANVTSATDRLNARSNVASNTAGTRFGYAGQMHQINSASKSAGLDRLMGSVGMGLNFAGDLAGAVAGAAGGGKGGMK